MPQVKAMHYRPGCWFFQLSRNDHSHLHCSNSRDWGHNVVMGSLKIIEGGHRVTKALNFHDHHKGHRVVQSPRS